ncbi:MAG: tryptophan-rich sensory protein [Ruminococcaceae bacterium]|nr:tryptophan-rich sensory protein [Oscillospiraceae bacterium]
MWKKAKPFIISIAIALSVGIISALLTRGNMGIYSEIKVPPLAPPAILFPIVWTILYVLMGVSAAVIYNKKDEMPEAVRAALDIYKISLFFNFAWSLIFFNAREFVAALVCIVFLLISIIKTVISYKKINWVAAYLQIPYTLWVAFATYLNTAIVFLNR